MAPQRAGLVRIVKRWSPYQTKLIQHRALARRRKIALVAISNSTYARATLESPFYFVCETMASLARRSKTTWYSLPNEILVEIARHCATPTREKNNRIQEWPVLYDIDISFSQTDRASRQAFLEYVSTNLVVAQLRFFRGPDSQFTDVPLQHGLNQVFKCRNIQRLFARVISSDSEKSMSFVRLDMQQYKGCGGFSVADIIVLAEREHILLLSEVMHLFVPHFNFLSIACWNNGKNSTRLLEDKLLEFFSVLRGVKEGILEVWGMPINFGRVRQSFSEILKPAFETVEGEEAMIRRKLKLLQDQGEDEDAQAADFNLFLFSLITKRHIRSLIKARIPLRIMHASLLLFEHVQRGFSNYLFSSPNSKSSRSHFLLNAKEGDALKLIEQSLKASSHFRERLRNMDLQQINDWAYFGDLVRLMISYAALEFALARALLSGHDDLGHIEPPWNPSITLRAWFLTVFTRRRYSLNTLKSLSLDYILNADKTLREIGRVRDILCRESMFLDNIRYASFSLWLAEAEMLSEELRQAYVRDDALLKPIPRLTQQGRI